MQRNPSFESYVSCNCAWQSTILDATGTRNMCNPFAKRGVATCTIHVNCRKSRSICWHLNCNKGREHVQPNPQRLLCLGVRGIDLFRFACFLVSLGTHTCEVVLAGVFEKLLPTFWESTLPWTSSALLAAVPRVLQNLVQVDDLIHGAQSKRVLKALIRCPCLDLGVICFLDAESVSSTLKVVSWCDD